MMLLWSPHLVHGSCKELVLPIRTGSTHGERLPPVVESLMTPEVQPELWQKQDAVRERPLPKGATDCCWWTTKGTDQAAVPPLARAMSQPTMPSVGTGAQEHIVWIPLQPLRRTLSALLCISNKTHECRCCWQLHAHPGSLQAPCCRQDPG
jgi:hypothetical protein